MKRTIVVAVALAAAVGGCKSKRNAKAREAAPAAAAPQEDELFIVARRRVQKAEVPPRFTGPLPSTVAGIDAAPPDPYVEAALAADAAGMRGKVLEALGKATAGGALEEDLHYYFSNRLRGAHPGLCDWIAAQLGGALPPAARPVFWEALAGCEGPATIAALGRDDAPDAAIIEWYFQTPGARVPFQPRVARAAAGVARGGERPEVRKIGFAFAAMDGPEVGPAMVALQRTISDPTLRGLAAIGLLHHPDQAVRALGVAACRAPGLDDEPMCGTDEDGDPSGTREPPAAIDDAVIDWEYEQAAILARFPRADVIAALERCALHPGEGASPDHCITRLAALDRAAAAKLAARLTADVDEDPALAAVITTLAAFPADGALERELATLGFTPAPGAAPATAPALTAEDVLTAYGRVTGFDTETGQWPNEHDGLLAELALLARPAFDGVIFEEVTPPDPDSDGPYQLRAYADGLRHEVTAENLGDWYDLEAVIGLLNALAIDRKQDVRFVVLPTGDQTATVLAGPRLGILGLVQKKLITIAAPDDAEAAGKAFEDRVFEELRREGKLPLRDVPITVPR